MAELRKTLDFSALLRNSRGPQVLVDSVGNFKQYRMAVILLLLKDDPTTRSLLAEAMGEASLRERAADYAAGADMHRTDFQSDGPEEKSWDEIMLECVEALLDTPGGRSEVI